MHKRGILLIALGSAHYGNMAANTAASIRFTCPELPIHLVYYGDAIAHLTDKHKDLFTSMQQIHESYITKHGKVNYLRAKTCIYDLSPFEETIFIDADLVVFGGKSFDKLFDSFKDLDFTMQNRGYEDLSKEVLNEKHCMWCNVAEVKEKYNTKGRFYNLASELIYFKKSDTNKAYFDLVKKIYDSPLVKATSFDTDIPDELAFDIASAVLEKYPHEDNKVWIHWYAADKKTSWSDIVVNYLGYSIGGNVLPKDVKAKYEAITSSQARALKLPFAFKVYPKKKWQASRKNI